MSNIQIETATVLFFEVRRKSVWVASNQSDQSNFVGRRFDSLKGNFNGSPKVCSVGLFGHLQSNLRLLRRYLPRSPHSQLTLTSQNDLNRAPLLSICH